MNFGKDLNTPPLKLSRVDSFPLEGCVCGCFGARRDWQRQNVQRRPGACRRIYTRQRRLSHDRKNGGYETIATRGDGAWTQRCRGPVRGKRGKSVMGLIAYVKNLDTPLLRVSPGDAFTLRDACAGVHIFGGIGSGKTSGSGRIVRRILARRYGRLCDCGETRRN